MHAANSSTIKSVLELLQGIRGLPIGEWESVAPQHFQTYKKIGQKSARLQESQP